MQDAQQFIMTKGVKFIIITGIFILQYKRSIIAISNENI